MTPSVQYDAQQLNAAMEVIFEKKCLNLNAKKYIY